MSTQPVMARDPGRRSSQAVVLVALGIGLALALAGNVYQFVRGEQIARDLALSQVNTEKQIARLTDAAQSAMEENQQRFEALKSDLEAATSNALKQARTEARRSNSQWAANLERKHRQVAGDLSALREETNSKLGKVSSDLEQTGSDLQRVSGDLGAVSGTVATNSRELAALKELGERNYFEFDLTKTKAPQKVGDLRVLLKKADPKHNRYTLEVLADDKRVEKKDKTINEPVQLYVSGSRQPYEIVVNQVKKNEVVGYLATPKVKLARGQNI